VLMQQRDYYKRLLAAVTVGGELLGIEVQYLQQLCYLMLIKGLDLFSSYSLEKQRNPSAS
jgi:hypothetical protein